MTPADLIEQLDAARLDVLGQYRRQRRLGRSPLMAMMVIREANASYIADMAIYGILPNTRQRERYIAACDYLSSMYARPPYWYTEQRRCFRG